MLQNIINMILSSELGIEDGILSCSGLKIDTKCLQYLCDQDCIVDSFYIEDHNAGELVDLKFSLQRLYSIGIYDTFDSFLNKNRYDPPFQEYYIIDLGCFSSSNNSLLEKYKVFLDFIKSLESIAKHNFLEADKTKNLIISRENNSVVVPLFYEKRDVESVDVFKLSKITAVFNGAGQKEQQLMYINELIDFLMPVPEKDRFGFLQMDFNLFYEKCNDAYQFYLSNFSSNKLKIELDTKILEFTSKIQSVINDSQTKLIAIPTAFVLAVTIMDFSNPYSAKNIATLISLFVFAILIQLFIDNQLTSLKFLSGNITSYIDSFPKNINGVNSRFEIVRQELKNQKRRLIISNILLWLIPVALLFWWFALMKFGFIVYIVAGFILALTLIYKLWQ